MHILMFRGGSQYNVLPRMTEALGAALQAAGGRVDWVDEDGREPQAAIELALQENPGAWLFAFGSFGAEFVTVEGRSIYDAAGCGFVGWDVDHPAYQFDRFATSIARSVHICASASHAAFARRIGAMGDAVLALPGVEAVALDPAPLDARPIYAMAAMSWLGEPQVWWRETRGAPVYDLVEAIVARLLADEAVDLLTAFDAACADLGLAAPLNAATVRMMAEISRFVRRHDRMRLAHALAALDIPRVICGRGWRERLGERAHLHYLEDLDVNDIGALYGQSRVVLNFNAANGASERAVMAMAAGAGVVSDFSPRLVETFGEVGALRVFRRTAPESLAETVMASLTAPDAQTRADAGHAEIAARGLWVHRAEQLLSALTVQDARATALAA